MGAILQGCGGKRSSGLVDTAEGGGEKWQDWSGGGRLVGGGEVPISPNTNREKKKKRERTEKDRDKSATRSWGKEGGGFRRPKIATLPFTRCGPRREVLSWAGEHSQRDAWSKISAFKEKKAKRS